MMWRSPLAQCAAIGALLFASIAAMYYTGTVAQSCVRLYRREEKGGFHWLANWLPASPELWNFIHYTGLNTMTMADLSSDFSKEDLASGFEKIGYAQAEATIAKLYGEFLKYPHQAAGACCQPLVQGHPVPGMYKTNVFCKPLQWGRCYNKYDGLWGDQEASGVGYIIERYSSNGAGQALKFTTLLDLASGVGANLRTLSTRIPGPHYFGADISKYMVAATFQRCGPLCSTVTYDLSVLQRAETNRSSLLAVFPAQRPPLTSFDIILVPDVLHTICWGVG